VSWENCAFVAGKGAGGAHPGAAERRAKDPGGNVKLALAPVLEIVIDIVPPGKTLRSQGQEPDSV
jgi:hypothetical protein